MRMIRVLIALMLLAGASLGGFVLTQDILTTIATTLGAVPLAQATGMDTIGGLALAFMLTLVVTTVICLRAQGMRVHRTARAQTEGPAE